MQRADEIAETLPKLDCGSCGAPSCHALAEDVALGLASEDDCIVRLRRRLQDVEGEDNA